MYSFQVNYINAHATSTIVGDLAELNAIKKVFKNTSGIKINATKVSLKLKLHMFVIMCVWICLLHMFTHLLSLTFENLSPHTLMFFTDHVVNCGFLTLHVFPVNDRTLPWCCWWFGSHCISESHYNRLASPYDKSICKYELIFAGGSSRELIQNPWFTYSWLHCSCYLSTSH